MTYLMHEWVLHINPIPPSKKTTKKSAKFCIFLNELKLLQNKKLQNLTNWP